MTAITLLFACTLVFLGNPAPQPGFLGLRVGMKAANALPIVNKKPDALAHVKSHTGQRVITDTLMISDCRTSDEAFPRLRFDYFPLTAIGLTYKTIPERIADAHDCAFKWLTKNVWPANFRNSRHCETRSVAIRWSKTYARS